MWMTVFLSASLVLGPLCGPERECSSRLSYSRPAMLAGQSESEIVLEGHVEVLVEDSDSGSRILYFLLADGDRVSLRFAVDPPHLTTGTPVRVRGRWESDGAFLVAAVERLPGN